MPRVQKQSKTIETCTKPIGIEEFKTEYKKGRYDFSNVVFEEGMDLNYMNLWSINFNGAKLAGADLKGANLWCTKLAGADLKGAKLAGADCRGTNFRDADLSDTDLSNADFEGADLEGADLEGANFRNVENLELIQGLGRAIFKNTKVTPEQERFIVAAQEKEGVKHFRLFRQFVVFEEKLRK